MKFTEAQLEAAIIEPLGAEGYPQVPGETIARTPQEVLIKEDLYIQLIDYAELVEFRKPEAGEVPVDRDEVYKKIFEQAENFKKYREA